MFILFEIQTEIKPFKGLEGITMGEYTENISHISMKLIIYSSDFLEFVQCFDSMDSEDAEKLKDKYLDEIIYNVKKWGGIANGISYDSVYASFGILESKGIREDTLNCVRMAIEMQAKIKNISKKWREQNIQLPFKIRCGIYTGEKIEPSTMAYKLSLATRIEEVCPPGKIYLSQSSWDLVKNEIPCKKVGVLKAYEFDPIQVYSVNLKKNDDTRARGNK